MRRIGSLPDVDRGRHDSGPGRDSETGKGEKEQAERTEERCNVMVGFDRPEETDAESRHQDRHGAHVKGARPGEPVIEVAVVQERCPDADDSDEGEHQQG